MIRVLVVDDHPALRQGLVAMLRAEPGLVPVGAAETANEALRQLEGKRPDLLLADYGLPDRDGLALCWKAKSLPSPPRVVIYSAFTRPRLVVAATLAGADALLDKSADADTLFELIRAVARGHSALPTVPVEVIKRCVAELDAADIPLFGMALNGVPPDEIAAVTRADLEDTRARLLNVIRRLQDSEARAELSSAV